jgi:hypothetical protein
VGRRSTADRRLDGERLADVTCSAGDAVAAAAAVVSFSNSFSSRSVMSSSDTSFSRNL